MGWLAAQAGCADLVFRQLGEKLGSNPDATDPPQPLTHHGKLGNDVRKLLLADEEGLEQEGWGREGGEGGREGGRGQQ